MCGRIGFRVLKKVFTERFGAGRIDLDAVFPRANVSPTDLVAGVRLEDGERVATPYIWGFMPPNAPDTKFISKYFTFNAVAETLLEKRLWPGPFKTRRCLVVASAWYEWPKALGAKKGTPHTILPASADLFAFAGLWGPWKDPRTGQGADTATIITTRPNRVFEEIHHRMPVVLGEDAWDLWLDPETPIPDLQTLLRPCPDDWLEIRPGGPETFQVEG